MSEPTEAIQPFKLDDAAKQLREKIRLAFVELIPPEQWEAMVKAELAAFLKPRPNAQADRWNGQQTTLPSVFSSVADEVYRAHVKELFKAELAKPEWSSQWTGQQHEIARAVKEWLTENAQALMQTTLKELFGYQAQRMIDNLRSGS